MSFTIRQRIVVCFMASSTSTLYLRELLQLVSSNQHDTVGVVAYLIGILVSLFSFYLITRDV